MTKYPLEHDEQKSFVSRFRLKYKDYLVFSIPNGAFLNGDKLQRSKQMKKLKDEGLTPSFPDLGILTKDNKILLLEMKRQNGSLSKGQKKLHPILKEMGYTVLVGYGAKDAMRKVEEVLK